MFLESLNTNALIHALGLEKEGPFNMKSESLNVLAVENKL